MLNTQPNSSRLNQVAARLPILLLLATAPFAGCDCSGEDEPEEGAVEQVVMLADGEGSPNDELLWRMQPGTRLGSAVILPPEDFHGVTAMPWALSYRGPSMAGAAPFEPSPWRYLSQDDEGNIWFHGQPREGRLDTPALLVPSEVRVGMKWQTSTAGRYTETFYGNTKVDYARCVNRDRRVHSGHDCKEGNPRFTVEVTGRRLEDTIYGVRPVWYFAITDWRAISFDGRKAWPNDKITDGASFVMRFAEGRGPLRNRLSPGGAEIGQGVIPLEEIPSQAALPQIELEALNGGQPVADNHIGHSASGYHLPGRFGEEPMLVSSGATLSYGQAAVEDTGFRQGQWSTVGQDHCQGPEEATDVDCFAGNYLTVAADGSSQKIAAVGGNSIDPDADLLAIYEDATGFQGMGSSHIGAAVGLSRAAITGNGAWTANQGDYIQHNPADVFWADPSGDVLRMLNLGGGHEHDEPALLFAAWNESTQRVSASHPAYPQHMDVNVFSGPAGKEVLLTTFGGRIDRVHLTDTGIELEPIGDVVLPNNQFMTGAVLVGDELVVYTQRGFKGGDPWYDRGFYNCATCEGVDWDLPPDLGETMMWRADLPTAQPAERPSSIWGVTAVRHGKDMKVCWPPGHDSPTLDGWTLGGHKPRTVAVLGGEDRCVLLIRDLAIADNLVAPSSWTIEGPLPGTGRVAIGTALNEGVGATHAANTPSTANGFLMSPGVVSRDAGTISIIDMEFMKAYADLHQLDLFRLSFNGLLVYADRAGGGLWMFDTGFKTLSRWDGETVHTYPDITLSETDFRDIPSSPGVVTFRGTSAAGGLLFESFHIGLDGTQYPVPPEVAAFADWVQLADGTYCGNRVPQSASGLVFSCLNNDTTYRDSTTPIDANAFLTGGDGNLYLLDSASGLVVYDTTTMTQYRVDLDALGIDSNSADTFELTTAQSPEGTTYGVFSVNRVAFSDHHLIRFGDVLTRISRPELQYLARMDNVPFAVGPEFYFFDELRVPREDDAERMESEFPAGEADCVPIVANEQGTLTSVMFTAMIASSCERDLLECLGSSASGVSYGPVGTGWHPAMCTQAEFWLNTNNGTADVIEVTDSKGLPVQHQILDLSERGQRIRIPSVPLFEKLTLRVQQGDSPPTTIDFKTANSGDRIDLGRIFVGEGAPGTLLGDIPAGRCGVMSPEVEGPDCDFSGAVDPATGRLLMTVSGHTKLIEAETSGVEITALTGPGQFSPDGSIIVGEGGVIHAETKQSIAAPAGVDWNVQPVYGLPEHPRVFLARTDGTGVVVEWNPTTGALTEGVMTQGAEFASFSGDGQSVVVLEPYQNTTDFEYSRYDLISGTRTVIWLGRRLDAFATNALGDAVYGYDPANRLVLVAQEGALERWSSWPLWQRTVDSDFAFAVNRRGKGAIWIRDANDPRDVTLVRFDEDAVPPMVGEPADNILAVTTLDKFAAQPRAAGDDSLVYFDGTDTIVAAAADGTTLQAFSGDWSVRPRLDGRLLMNPNNCGSDPTGCRRIVALTTNASGVHEDISDPDHHQEPWPYGAERERHEAFGQTSVQNSQLYWRHFDPTGLDMPCLIFEGYQYDYRSAFNGENITLVPGIYCY